VIQKIINKRLNFIYGRTNTPRKIFKGKEGTSLMYFEAYCVGCNKSLLPNGTDSNSTNDPRWFVNTLHNTATDGIVGTITQKNAAKVTNTAIVPTTPSQATLNYNETSGYPYKATMENNASNWLIYNKHDINDTNNEFEVEFLKNSAGWGGVDDSNSTTNSNSSTKTNRRIMW